MTLRALIVEDEPLGYRRLFDILSNQSDVEVVGWARDGDDAIKAIQSLKPNVVFLDVQMPGTSGLDVIHAISPDRMPATIFVTAHNNYAVEAFEMAAADYLKKPYTDERVEEALRRVRRNVESGTMGDLSARLLSLLEDGPQRRSSPHRGDVEPYLARITVESRGKLRVIPVSEINRFHADGPYAELFVGGKKYLVRESLASLEANLDPHQFCRIHRSEIVALDFIDCYIRGGGSYMVQLRNGDTLPVGRSYRKELERRLGVSIRDA